MFFPSLSLCVQLPLCSISWCTVFSLCPFFALDGSKHSVLPTAGWLHLTHKKVRTHRNRLLLLLLSCFVSFRLVWFRCILFHFFTYDLGASTRCFVVSLTCFSFFFLVAALWSLVRLHLLLLLAHRLGSGHRNGHMPFPSLTQIANNRSQQTKLHRHRQQQQQQQQQRKHKAPREPFLVSCPSLVLPSFLLVLLGSVQGRLLDRHFITHVRLSLFSSPLLCTQLQ